MGRGVRRAFPNRPLEEPVSSLSELTRRRLLASGASSFVVAALMGDAAFAQDATPAATPDGTFAPQTGIERDEMVIDVQGLPATLDPAQELSNVGSRVNWTPYDTLVRRDFLNGNVYVPHLAESWVRTSDTVLELTLRQGVTFHDGSPFTADEDRKSVV